MSAGSVSDQEEVTITVLDVDEVAPKFTGGTVSGNTVVLTFDEALDEGSTPTMIRFTITGWTSLILPFQALR